jgi:prepilin-type processing-associated H-X9-DG protein/prepilin-type N-terminal cleavage/methylation domain-containing protein
MRQDETSSARRAGGFTLVELLLAVAVISILAARLLPAVLRAKAPAQSAKCVSNLRQWALAAQMYWDDNAGAAFPYGGQATTNGALYWFGWIGPGPETTRAFDPRQSALFSYLGTEVNLCPSFDYSSAQFKLKASVPTCDYGYNLNLSPTGQAPLNLRKLQGLANLALLADSAQVNTFEAPASAKNPMFEEWYYIDFDASQPNAQFRHGLGANVAFCDGHVGRETMAAGTLDARLPRENIGLLRPAILVPAN